MLGFLTIFCDLFSHSFRECMRGLDDLLKRDLNHFPANVAAVSCFTGDDLSVFQVDTVTVKDMLTSLAI